MRQRLATPRRVTDPEPLAPTTHLPQAATAAVRAAASLQQPRHVPRNTKIPKHEPPSTARACRSKGRTPELLDDALRGVLPLEAGKGRLLRHHPEELHQPAPVGLEGQKPARERHHEVHESLARHDNTSPVTWSVGTSIGGGGTDKSEPKSEGGDALNATAKGGSCVLRAPTFGLGKPRLFSRSKPRLFSRSRDRRKRSFSDELAPLPSRRSAANIDGRKTAVRDEVDEKKKNSRPRTR